MAKSFTINDVLFNLINHHFYQLQQNYSKLLPIRADFHYLKDTPITYHKAYTDMMLLYRLLRTTMPYVVGLTFVMEYSSTQNLHIHAIFYVNGQLHQRYYPIYQQINTLWLTKVSSALNTHDCNAKQQKYAFNALQNTCYHNEYVNDALSYVFEYMSKNEQKENIPRFYRGFTSYVVPKSNRGRPRKYS